MTRPQEPLSLREFAAALLDGPWGEVELVERARTACRKSAKWVRALIRRILAAFPVAPDAEYLERFLESDAAVRKAFLGARTYSLRLPLPVPHPATAGWGVPLFATSAKLAEWFGVSVGRLEWLADCQSRNGGEAAEELRHYRYRWLPKRNGGFRLLEVPKPLLCRLQRKVLREVLDRIPPHESAHAYRKGRSVASYVAPHTGKRIVLCFDLRDFFPSVPASRVHCLLHTAGYPTAVARLLTGLCTTRMPCDVWHQRPDPLDSPATRASWGRLRGPHLPQGAPTSPALANLAAFRLDCRLAGVARRLGAEYTRYADDLAFSGGAKLERAARRLQVFAGRVALEEGFTLHARKSRFMRQGVRQQLAGVVVNVRPNLRRSEYDDLKATLFNCARSAPDEQNREGHPDFRQYLLGRIGYVRLLNPARAAKLRALFDRIRWPE